MAFNKKLLNIHEYLKKDILEETQQPERCTNMAFNKQLFNTHEYLKKHIIEEKPDSRYVTKCSGCGMIFISSWHRPEPISSMCLSDDDWRAAKKLAAEDELREMLLAGNRGALTVAERMDKGPNDETRKVACGDPDIAFDYSVTIDKCYHPDTFKAIALADDTYHMRQYIDSLCITPSDETRLLLNNAENAYHYAKHVDMMRPNAITRTLACKSPSIAYIYALEVDMCPTDETRKAACESPQEAIKYARDVDKGWHEETYRACLTDPNSAYEYARDIIGKPTDETRAAACTCASVAFEYAKYVDRGPHDVTRAAAIRDSSVSVQYALNIDKAPRDDTRKGTYRSAYAALSYAKNVDRCPHPKTKSSASRVNSGSSSVYERFESSWKREQERLKTLGGSASFPTQGHTIKNEGN